AHPPARRAAAGRDDRLHADAAASTGTPLRRTNAVGARRGGGVRGGDALAGRGDPVMSDDWFLRFEADARARGDRERLRLWYLGHDADRHRESAPDRMLATLEEGRHLARGLHEPWWELFYDDRRAGALMKYKGDTKAGLELAVRNMLQLRKPLYDGFP